MGELDRCFALLGLSPGASVEEVKAAYRKLAGVWHPDRFAGDFPQRKRAAEKFSEINRAVSEIEAAREAGLLKIKPQPQRRPAPRYRPAARPTPARAEESGGPYGKIALAVAALAQLPQPVADPGRFPA